MQQFLHNYGYFADHLDAFEEEEQVVLFVREPDFFVGCYYFHYFQFPGCFH